MPRYPALPRRLLKELEAVPPSRDRDVRYYPCAVTLDDGRELGRVYVVEYEPYIRLWGVTSEQDPAKRSISIERVVSIRESPFRLPPHLAASLYSAGESGMGYCIFTVEFSDGSQQAYVTGNAVDFITPPPGLAAREATMVYPDKGREASPQRGPEYIWCLYEGVSDAA